MPRKKQVKKISELPLSLSLEINHGGIGTTIGEVLEATGIKKLVEIFIDGKDCGCDKRKEQLNELFPYKFKARCLTEEEYNEYKTFKEERSLRTMKWDKVQYICKLYASVFSRGYWEPCTGCSPQPILSMIDKLDKVFDTYEN